MPDKKRERYYLDVLRRTVGEIPLDEPAEPEPPDFLFTATAERLGIEFTTFHLPPASGARPHQEQQRLKDRVVELAEYLHYEAGGPALYVGVYFNERLLLDKKDTQKLARSIADSVLRSPVPRSMDEPVEIPWSLRPEETRGIQLLPSINGKDKLWHADAGGWVATISPKHLSDVLVAKAKMEVRARRRCDKLWLVIVNDYFSAAAPADASPEALAHTYDTCFDRVILLLPHVPQAVELQLESRTIQRGGET